MTTNNPSGDGFWRLANLTDDQLLASLDSLLAAHRRVTARLVAHLAEVEDRRLHLRLACPSMFAYCTDRLGLSEDEACRRIDAARIARMVPLAYTLLDSGKVSLTVLCLLKEHLTPGNSEELLAGVSGKSVRHAREWLAGRFPQPDVPSLIRKLPEPRVASDSGEHAALATVTAAPAAARSVPEAEPIPTPAPTNAHTAAGPPAAPARPARDGRIDPLSEARYRVQFTASRELKEKLEMARDLMSHAQPGAELAVIVERALDLLVEDLMKKRFGKTSRPRRSRDAQPDRVTNATRRVVVDRDGLACSYVDAQGRRCNARALLEHDHAIARGRGGSSEPHNMRLRCGAHNRFTAELEYGREHIERAVARRRARGPSGGGPPR